MRELHWDFAGIVFEFSADYGIMLLRRAGIIEPDGSINP